MSFLAVIANIASRGKRYVTGMELTDGDGRLRRSLDTSNIMEDSSGNALHQTGEELPDGSRAGHVVVKGIADDITITINNYEAATLQNAATSTGNGDAYTVGGKKELMISITGANVTTSTIVFEGADVDGNYSLIQGMRLSDLVMASNTSTVQSTSSEKWLIPIAGLTLFRARISTLTGTDATISIKGVAVV